MLFSLFFWSHLLWLWVSPHLSVCSYGGVVTHKRLNAVVFCARSVCVCAMVVCMCWGFGGDGGGRRTVVVHVLELKILQKCAGSLFLLVWLRYNSSRFFLRCWCRAFFFSTKITNTCPPPLLAQEPLAKGTGLSVRSCGSGPNSMNITGGMTGTNGTHLFWFIQ